MNSKRIYLFIDGANVFYAQQNNDFWIDWTKLIEYLEKENEGKIIQAFYYIGRHKTQMEQADKYLKFLQNIGFTVRQKDLKHFVDPETSKRSSKANLDIEIVFDMMNTIAHYDTAVLFSGDGDFVRMVEWVREKGKEIFIYAETRSIAQELRNAAGMHYVDFTKLEEIRRSK